MSRRMRTSRESGSSDSITSASARLTSLLRSELVGRRSGRGQGRAEASSESSSAGAYLARRRRLMQKLRAIV